MPLRRTVRGVFSLPVKDAGEIAGKPKAERHTTTSSRLLVP
jgi:hypothetical protein